MQLGDIQLQNEADYVAVRSPAYLKQPPSSHEGCLSSGGETKAGASFTSLCVETSLPGSSAHK